MLGRSQEEAEKKARLVGWRMPSLLGWRLLGLGLKQSMLNSDEFVAVFSGFLLTLGTSLLTACSVVDPLHLMSAPQPLLQLGEAAVAPPAHTVRTSV